MNARLTDERPADCLVLEGDEGKTYVVKVGNGDVFNVPNCDKLARFLSHGLVALQIDPPSCAKSAARAGQPGIC